MAGIFSFYRASAYFDVFGNVVVDHNSQACQVDPLTVLSVYTIVNVNVLFSMINNAVVSVEAAELKYFRMLSQETVYLEARIY